jgi:hypothetical protein
VSRASGLLGRPRAEARDAAGQAGGDEAQIRRTDPGGEERGLRPKPDRRLGITAAGSGDQGVGPSAAKTDEASGVIEAFGEAVTRRTSPLRPPLRPWQGKGSDCVGGWLVSPAAWSGQVSTAAAGDEGVEIDDAHRKSQIPARTGNAARTTTSGIASQSLLLIPGV